MVKFFSSINIFSASERNSPELVVHGQITQAVEISNSSKQALGVTTQQLSKF